MRATRVKERQLNAARLQLTNAEQNFIKVKQAHHEAVTNLAEWEEYERERDTTLFAYREQVNQGYAELDQCRRPLPYNEQAVARAQLSVILARHSLAASQSMAMSNSGSYQEAVLITEKELDNATEKLEGARTKLSQSKDEEALALDHTASGNRDLGLVGISFAGRDKLHRSSVTTRSSKI